MTFCSINNKVMGSKGSKTVEKHYIVEQVADPETLAKLETLKIEIDDLEKEAQKLHDPNHFTENVNKIFTRFVEEIPKLNLRDIINKRPGEIHLAVAGNTSCGKSTLLNAMYNLSLETALGHCTDECEVVHMQDNKVVWDMPGTNQDFKFYDVEQLSFIKSLDKCIVLFDTDISSISLIIRTIHKLNPDSLVLARTKVDQHQEGDQRTIEEEKERDINEVKTLLNLDTEENIQVYSISSLSILQGKEEEYDWNDFKDLISFSE